MHKLMEYICEELEELERKAAKEGKLSMAEIQYADLLAHTKKNLLKSEEMMEESEYSMAGGSSYRGSSYRGGGSSYRGGGSSYRGGGSSYDGAESNQSRMGGSSYEGSSYAESFVRPDGSYRDGGSSYARGRGRGAKRDAMGRYSSAEDEIVDGLMKLAEKAPDEHTRSEIMKLMEKM